MEPAKLGGSSLVTRHHPIGLCGARLEPAYRYEEKILKLCPYQTKDNLTPLETLTLRCPTCPLANIKHTDDETYNETLAYVKIIIPNETNKTQQILAKTATRNLPKKTPTGYSRNQLILGSIYLASKLPDSSPRPLKINEITDKVKPFIWTTGHKSSRLAGWKKDQEKAKQVSRIIRRGASVLRRMRAYPEVCKVSTLQHIVSRRRDLCEHLTTEQYLNIIGIARQLEQSKEYYRWRQGKSPTVTAASIIYALSSQQDLGITHPVLADIFSITRVSIRNQIPAIKGFIEKLEAPVR